MAYCLRNCGSIHTVGKLRGAWLYAKTGRKAAA
jgi:hypothetical protein